MTPSGAKSPRDALEEARALLSGLDDDRAVAVLREIERALGGMADEETPTGTRRRVRDPASCVAPAPFDPALPAELLDVACHDMRDPLAAIVMGSAFLAKSLPADDARARRLVNGIQRSAERLTRTVQNLLDFAKLERGALVLVKGEHELGALVEEGAMRLSPLATERGVQVVLDVVGPAHRFSCDVERIAQAIAHLGSNAVRYSPPGQTVIIRGRRTERSVEISIVDHGPGITGDRRDHLFERYYHMRRSPRDGTGLGIAIARGIVEAHGGSVRLDSTGNEGTTFTLAFPGR
jgi:signal transduction histidine kinase